MPSSFQTKVIKEHEAKGWIVINIIRLSDSGYPDILCMKENEKDRWIECKEGKDTLKELQKYRIDELNRIGKNAYCLHDTKGVVYPSPNSNN